MLYFQKKEENNMINKRIRDLREDNDKTQKEGKIGTEDNAVINVGKRLTNKGEILTAEDLSIDSGNVLNSGDFVSGGNLKVSVTDTFASSEGQIVANRKMELTAGNVELSGGEVLGGDIGTFATTKGQFSSLANISILKDASFVIADNLLLGGTFANGGKSSFNVACDFENSSNFVTDKDLIITAENIINTGKITVVGENEFTANKDFSNSGEIINISDSTYSVKGTLNNSGLLNAANNYLEAGELDNINSGRIYGDDIFIKATTINNVTEEGSSSSPVIASRNDLKIETKEITNKDKAQLFALNDMEITAKVLNNYSASIETGNDLTLNVGTVNNQDIHFEISDELEEIGL